MAGIKGKNTKPEMIIRKALFARGYRYRLHDKKLPGKPDIVFPGRKAVIFIHGCFWHGHGCHLFKKPSSNVDFWEAKIERNRIVDSRSVEALLTRGWRILTIWECAIKGKKKIHFDDLIKSTVSWLNNSASNYEIKGIS